MAVEPKRGCGYRKVGGLYLVGKGIFEPCHRLPVKIPQINFFRGYKEINPYKLINNICEPSKHCSFCNICNPENIDNVHGLMFVGEQYYTPSGFINEAIKLGVCKRISNIPESLIIGKTIIYLAYKKIPFKIENGTEYYPAIFMSFKPDKIEKIITESSATEEYLEKLKEKGITPVVVPDNDKDHR